MSVQVEDAPREAVFSVTGAFDPFAASRFRARVDELAPDEPVVLDFSRASEVSDLALAMLASAFEKSRHPRVVLRGLTRHHQRMLRYLGVERVVVD